MPERQGNSPEQHTKVTFQEKVGRAYTAVVQPYVDDLKHVSSDALRRMDQVGDFLFGSFFPPHVAPATVSVRAAAHIARTADQQDQQDPLAQNNLYFGNPFGRGGFMRRGGATTARATGSAFKGGFVKLFGRYKYQRFPTEEFTPRTPPGGKAPKPTKILSKSMVPPGSAVNTQAATGRSRNRAGAIVTVGRRSSAGIFEEAERIKYATQVEYQMDRLHAAGPPFANREDYRGQAEADILEAALYFLDDEEMSAVQLGLLGKVDEHLSAVPANRIGLAEGAVAAGLKIFETAIVNPDLTAYSPVLGSHTGEFWHDVVLDTFFNVTSLSLSRYLVEKLGVSPLSAEKLDKKRRELHNAAVLRINASGTAYGTRRFEGQRAEGRTPVPLSLKPIDLEQKPPTQARPSGQQKPGVGGAIHQIWSAAVGNLDRGRAFLVLGIAARNAAPYIAPIIPPGAVPNSVLLPYNIAVWLLTVGWPIYKGVKTGLIPPIQ